MLSVLSVLFLSVCEIVSPHSRIPVYQEYRLESVCGNSKNTIHLGKKPAVLTYGGGGGTDHLQCHIELQVVSEEFGFYVFLDKVWLDNSAGCQQDFLQFGRDFAFLTSYKSKKYCERIDPTTTVTQDTEGGTLSRIEFGATSTSAREYVETNDQDMDLWISITPGTRHKELRLVVTPFKKTCSSSDTWWWPCQGSGQCVRRDLLCDGVLNCAGGDEEEAVCVTRVYPAGLYINLPLVLLCALAGVCCVLCVLCVAKLAVTWVRRLQDTTEDDRVIERVKSEEREVVEHPSAPPEEELSYLPPSYSEAVNTASNSGHPPTYSHSYHTNMFR